MAEKLQEESLCAQNVLSSRRATWPMKGPDSACQLTLGLLSILKALRMILHTQNEFVELADVEQNGQHQHAP